MERNKISKPARMFGIIARESPVAVIFRRGPSKWVQIIRWNLNDDRFEFGQWFHGRIYEHRCDLSPDGSLLIYFASKFNKKTVKDQEYTYAWTAISKPPYLTALALWPKGDCWHGGGLFESRDLVFLNHKPMSAEAHKNHQPVGIAVKPNPNASGEDGPIFTMRLPYYGWHKIQEWEVSYSYPEFYSTKKPEVWEKEMKSMKSIIRMTQSIKGLDYTEKYFRVSKKKETFMSNEWADFDVKNNRIVFAKEGKLLSIDVSGKQEEIIDLNKQKPENVKSPKWASEW